MEYDQKICLLLKFNFKSCFIFIWKCYIVIVKYSRICLVKPKPVKIPSLIECTWTGTSVHVLKRNATLTLHSILNVRHQMSIIRQTQYMHSRNYNHHAQHHKREVHNMNDCLSLFTQIYVNAHGMSYLEA